MNGGKLVVELLKEQGTRCVFGVPGGQTLFVNDALYDSDIEFIQTRHEGGAASAADAYGRITGKPGICLATTGPGATNLITGIGGAFRDSSPMIVLLFQNRAADVGRGDAQEANHEALFSSICKEFIPVYNISKLAWAMRQAYRVAVTGRPGPVVVDLYRDVVESQEADYEYIAPEKYCFQSKCRPLDSEIQKCIDLLKKNNKIAILSGNGVKYSGAGDVVLEFAKHLDAPIVTTFNGISGVPTTDRNVMGARSRHGSQFTRYILEDADLVVVLGSSLTAISTNRWSLGFKKMIQIDIDPQNIGKHYPVECGLVGTIDETLTLINQNLKENPIKDSARSEWFDQIEEKKKSWEADVLGKIDSDVDATPVSPVAVMNELSKLIREDSVVCVDAGNPGAWSHLLEIKPGVKYLKPVNFGNMGFAIPAGIAGKAAYPEKEVISILGDGSLGMTLAELETAARQNKRQMIIVLNDSAYGNIKQEEEFKFGDRYIGVDFTESDYVKVAEGLGCRSYKVTKASQLAGIFKDFREAGTDEPFVIDLSLNGNISVWPEAF
ncbi:MAG TPA: thiamine pyrophosphate-binding protein [Bacillota bacterium]|nr:thiamine pyrophosphate-binding protein [Bacillota bacterium]